MCPVATTSATHQAHKFSSLLPHIDLTTASSKEPMNLKYTPYADLIGMEVQLQVPVTAMIQGQMSLNDGARRMTTIANGLLRKGKALIG